MSNETSSLLSSESGSRQTLEAGRHFSYSDWNRHKRILIGAKSTALVLVVLPFVIWVTIMNGHSKWPQEDAINNDKNNTNPINTTSTTATVPATDSHVPNFEHGSNTIQIHYQSFTPQVDTQQQHKHLPDSHDMGYCVDNSFYNLFTLRTAYELSIHALLPFGSSFKVPFAASGITRTTFLNPLTQQDTSSYPHLWYAVAENSWSILEFNPSLYPPGSADNRWIHHPIFQDRILKQSPKEISQEKSVTDHVSSSSTKTTTTTTTSNYHAISHFNDTFYIVRRSVRHFFNRRRRRLEEFDITERNMKKSVDKNKQTSNTKTQTHSSEDDGDDVFSYHAIIEEIQFKSSSDVYDIVDQCRCEMAFDGPSSGFKGAVTMPGIDGALYILALCDSNHCSEKKRDDPGNGKIVLLRKQKKNLYSPALSTLPPTASPLATPTNIPLSINDTSVRYEKKMAKGTSADREEDLLPEIQDIIDLEKEHYGECVWETIRVLDIPKLAYFRDYSDLDITNDGKIIIASQQESAVYVGRLKGITEAILHPDEIRFEKDESGIILSFPKSDSCYNKYCNIEGIHVMNDHMIMGVSGIMQDMGQQDFRCFDKQQTIHSFILP